MDSFGRRLKTIRNEILGDTLQELGDVIGVKKAQLSQVENGRANLGAEAIFKLVDYIQDKADVRYLFGQMDSIEHANLKERGLSTTDNVIRLLEKQKSEMDELRGELRDKVRSQSDVSELARKVDIDQRFHDVVVKIVKLDRKYWPKIESYVDGMQAMLSDDGIADKHANAG